MLVAFNMHVGKCCPVGENLRVESNDSHHNGYLRAMCFVWQVGEEAVDDPHRAHSKLLL